MDTTLLKGLRVLEELAQSDDGRGVSELARELGVPRSNMHRTLSTLSEAGYIRHDGDSAKYSCTLKLFELGSRVATRLDAATVARRYMRGLAAATRETIHLAALDGVEVLYLDIIESPQPVRAYSTLGGRAPAHCVASGKALLASLDADDLAQRFSGGLRRWTDTSVGSLAELQRELVEVRKTGCAINRGEWRDTVGGIAAVIRDASGYASVAIGVSGPLDRIDVDSAKVQRVVCQTAAAASAELGWRPTEPDACNSRGDGDHPHDRGERGEQ